ncbi:leucyl aminopeptidase family protein [Nocardioides marmotae]|uniref:Probable cytosol aminopeptidase n=1 Tax=Nocardioides marmotae TaxID=2663857 RepID=A0A6I3IYX7_9ACTN|nr:leucyl aminopeptidase family protein [Nocardioides marmotae]MCR6030641.1 leucyl aminopeptidase [Gordonia jinghuaiqii]MBC9734175.1 leucyl aminopeptidase family protein [Nocardioides marmotae]MTB85278.1 leucyl aminopeptidase [Nocardioides marmotae]MTB94277.1 leucyl aminopeptidase [Nocardioides marmotae]QKE00553.1 leucyl aminopeptidase family protein [Nocardioides marmotae]
MPPTEHPAHPTLPPQVSPPRFALSAERPLAVDGADVVALPVLPGEGDGAAPLLGPGAEEVTDRLGVDLLALLESERATGRAGQVVTYPVPLGTPDQPALRRVLLVGVGEQRPADFRKAGAALARAVTDTSPDTSTVATTVPALDPDHGLEPFVVGFVLASFGFSWRSTGPERLPAEQVVLAALEPAAYDAALDRARAVAGAGWRARTLATVPSNLKNPVWLAEEARRVAGEAGLGFRVWDEQQLAEEGFGGILGVGQASATPPRLVQLEYTPPLAGRGTPTVVLVGKGITFDTGGLSIKPAQAMTNMKRDMTGGAVVLATMAALADVGCPVRVVGLVPMAENAVSGNALRPGDVVRHWGGRTTEITNTDAEGRVVMADALAYAVAELDPAVVVDVATLTGAMKVALGQQVGGFFANREVLAAAIAAAGEAAGEPLWRMPLAAVYEDKLASKVADADNGAGGPGAITAALFLQHFVGDVPWAHLDVASVGDAPAEMDEWTEGPTGFGARALLAWLGGEAPLDGIVAGS